MFRSRGSYFWKKKKIFITGHTGFKGSWLCLMLNYLGAKVIGYSLKPDGSNVIYEQSGIKKNLINYYGDIRDKRKLDLCIKKSKPDIIFHLAAQPIVLDSYKNPQETFEVNFNGTLNILNAIKEHNIKSSVIVTTDKVYKNKNKVIAFKELDELGGDDPYSASKTAVEILVNSYNFSFFKANVKVATVRAGNVIGGGDRANKRILPDFFRCKQTKKKLNVRSANSLRPWQFVLEPLTGYLMIAEANYRKKIPTYIKQTWNFAPTKNKVYTVKEIINKLNVFFKISVKFKKTKSNLEKTYLNLSSLKSKKYLNWKSHYGIKKTMEEIANWELNEIHNKNIRSFSEFQIKNYLKVLKWK
jgi:CDP-glucose 4,6-dehydratase